jgi:hypothetical protein
MVRYERISHGIGLALGGLAGISLSECAKESGANPMLTDLALMGIGWLVATRWTFFGLGIVGIASARFILQIVEREQESAFKCPFRLLFGQAR